MKLNEIRTNVVKAIDNASRPKTTNNNTAQVDVITSAAPYASATTNNGVSAGATGAAAGLSKSVNKASTKATASTGTSSSGSSSTSSTSDTKSTYMDQLTSLYDQIVNRGSFSYDLNGDMLYQQMADQYTELGRQAMRDSTGTAAALTGGYGNSYANLVGNQAYQSYLTQLNDNIPELYELAYEAWQDEGEELESKYDATLSHIENLKAYAPTTTSSSTSTKNETSDTEKATDDDDTDSDALLTTDGTTDQYTAYYYALLDELSKKK